MWIGDGRFTGNGRIWKDIFKFNQYQHIAKHNKSPGEGTVHGVYLS